MDISTALAKLLEGHDIVVTISTRARSVAPAQDRPTADTKKPSKKKAAPKVEPEAVDDDGGDDWGSMFGPST